MISDTRTKTSHRELAKGTRLVDVPEGPPEGFSSSKDYPMTEWELIESSLFEAFPDLKYEVWGNQITLLKSSGRYFFDVIDHLEGLGYRARASSRVSLTIEIDFDAPEGAEEDEDFSDLLDEAEVFATEPTRVGMLLKAAITVGVDRNADYEEPLVDFTRTVAMWNGLLARKLAEPLTCGDMSAMMICLKLSRLQATPDHADSWLDAAGYAACGAEVSGIDPETYAA